jgi:hypothetical protein
MVVSRHPPVFKAEDFSEVCLPRRDTGIRRVKSGPEELLIHPGEIGFKQEAVGFLNRTDAGKP